MNAEYGTEKWKKQTLKGLSEMLKELLEDDSLNYEALSEELYWKFNSSIGSLKASILWINELRKDPKYKNIDLKF